MTALQSTTELPTSFAQPSQRAECCHSGQTDPPAAYRYHPPKTWQPASGAIRRPATRISRRPNPPHLSLQSPASIEMTIKTHRAGVVERFSPIHF
jgi:hypothetical protein